ncbi:hypothetical protein PPL_09844 [Heterostelium album PN500]|uniref:DUF3447 domain-containing protein n=1 Tax=Heterostelium pallidum (strain ATCC 26659 / Pp 5 / PN500) TaxID=670386 RepID=D3BP81_HETP5|nr:hypothetical protein PPL_09844 [Heterostelium album PN500]EFA77091.1 hypothetical protein PPL_09844 [Heterostelium album PN500]|eukprot:XP_020429220.1 hypothetical protein PPL_09844 [Heterostelium album PN500]
MNKDIYNRVFNNQFLKDTIFRNIRWIFQEFEGCYLDSQLFSWRELEKRPDIAIQYNYFDVVKRYFSELKLSTRKYEVSDTRLLINTAIYALKNDQLDVLKFLVGENGAPNGSHINYSFDRDDLEDITKIPALIASPLSGSLELCKWAANTFKEAKKLVTMDSDRNPHDEIYENAAKSGKLEILQWSFEMYHRELGRKSHIWRSACIGNNIDMLNFMFLQPQINRLFNVYDLIDEAVKSKQVTIEVLEWLFSHNANYNTEQLLENAIQRGSVEVIKCLYKHLGNNDNNNENDSNNQFNLIAIEWFLKNCKDRELKVFELAISNNSLAIIQWVHQYSSVEGETNCLDIAVKNRYFNLLAWFTRNERRECYSKSVLEQVYIKNQMEEFEWLHENRTERCDPVRFKKLYFRYPWTISNNIKNIYRSYTFDLKKLPVFGHFLIFMVTSKSQFCFA